MLLVVIFFISDPFLADLNYFRLMNCADKKSKLRNLELITTGDGSHTLFVPWLNEHYHSTFGAVSESLHVFIQAGFRFVIRDTSEVRLLEVGMGTGLNAMLTLEEADKENIRLQYTGVEPYPLPWEILGKLNYPAQCHTIQAGRWWQQIHKEANWNEWHSFTSNLALMKWRGFFEDFIPEHAGSYNLVYFDAFAPTVQPDLWEFQIFEKLAPWVEPGGVLVSYSSKGSFR